ncbi:hypothetical protein ACIRG5_21950 [Lentzea sp. NPDC102401]|uniref:hypothetical protein n=1 Tax=Lentzea sp. NPDC102401 TaxID=3364128 RepID=UPI00381D75BA
MRSDLTGLAGMPDEPAARLVLTQAEIAARLSVVAGREIRHVDLPVAEFAKRLVAPGVPEAFAARQVWTIEVHTFE